MAELPDTLDGPQWLALLEKLAERLGKDGEPVSLCLIGSAACLFGGMEGRTSRDLDVWRPVSDYDRRELREATEASGILFDPKGALEPDRPYLQIVDRGVVETGSFAPVLVDRIGRLYLFRPPIENIVASKLIRGDERDIADVMFLKHLHQPDTASIRAIVATFSPANRQRAEENLIFLDLTLP